MDTTRQLDGGLGGGRIAELDGLRGIAIGMVVVYHYFITEMGADPKTLGAYTLAAGRLGWSGVDLFFVLSGFLIGGILLDARTSSNYFRVFYTRRFFRIVPIYAVLLAASFLIFTLIGVGLVPRLAGLSRDALPWFPYVVFLQNFWMAGAATYGASLLSSTWSLAVEEQFYLTLPLVVRLASPRRLVKLLAVGVLAAPILRFAWHTLWPNDYIASYAMMPCRADSLLLGALGAVIVRNERCCEWLKARRNAFLAVLVALFAGMAGLTRYAEDFTNPKGTLAITFGYSWIALFYVCVLLYAVTWQDSRLSWYLRLRPLRWLGSIAYGVYLFHLPILYVLYGVIWSRPPAILTTANLLVTLVALAITLLVCQVSWTWFEKPLVKRGHREGYEFGDAREAIGISPVAVTEG